MRISIGPGGAAKEVLAPGAAGAAALVVVAGAAAGVSCSPPTGPRKSGRPSAAVAVSTTRDGASLARAPSPLTSGSQTKVTRGLPVTWSKPVQNRAACPLLTGSAIAFKAREISGGGPALGGAVARATSSTV